MQAAELVPGMTAGLASKEAADIGTEAMTSRTHEPIPRLSVPHEAAGGRNVRMTILNWPGRDALPPVRKWSASAPRQLYRDRRISVEEVQVSAGTGKPFAHQVIRFAAERTVVQVLLPRSPYVDARLDDAAGQAGQALQHLRKASAAVRMPGPGRCPWQLSAAERRPVPGSPLVMAAGRGHAARPAHERPSAVTMARRQVRGALSERVPPRC
jgi:hypothetical protein